MNFLDEEIDKYVCEHTENEPQELYELNRETNLNVLIPRMLSGHFQGRLLSMLSHMIQPKNVLEIGTYTGYSALCFAEGLEKDGKIITIDKNDELEEIIEKYISKTNNQDRIQFLRGDARDIIPNLYEEWDLVFIDADKTNYSNYFDLVIDKMPSGGYIIADNVLWSGKVVDAMANDPDTLALKEFNRKVHEDSRVQNVLLPIRDGLMILRKN